MDLELDPVDQRVLGSLLEKERTVPATYPLTLNALRSACNQTSGRDPITDLGDHDLLASIDRLKALGLARIVHAGAGSRATKYRQVLDERLGLDDGERAVLTLLLLRGAQTPGELRSRAERLHPFADSEDVERTLGALRDRPEPLVSEHDRRLGQRERRWVHLLGPIAAETAVDTAAPPTATGRRPAGNEDVLAAGADARDGLVVSTYDDVAADYADALIDELDRKPFDRWLLELLARDAGDGPVADVGCGPGHVGAHLALAGARVTGFDLSPGMVAEARRRFPELTFEVADLRELPGPPDGGGWALLAAWYSLVHLAGSELPGAVASLAGRLRPGGRLAVAVHLGAQVRHIDDWFERPVHLDFALHDPADVLAAFAAAGLVDVQWYRRSPVRGAETDTERMYVLGTGPG
jgi:uncharacterized protein YceH (UPF0502 family)/trans-aconitate methyltransferase